MWIFKEVSSPRGLLIVVLFDSLDYKERRQWGLGSLYHTLRSRFIP